MVGFSVSDKKMLEHTSNANRFVQVSRRALGLLNVFWHDEFGAELIQFVLVLPIMLGLMWTTFEAWQLVTVRAAIRSTASQVTRYAAAYGAPQEGQGPSTDPNMICDGVRQMVTASLAQHRGNLGDNLDWSLRWYWVLDPNSSQWDGNVELACVQTRSDSGDDCCAAMFSSLPCNQQFAIELEVSVPWQTVVFGLDGSTKTDAVLSITERATGSAPCVPYCGIRAGGYTISGGEEGCIAEVCWGWEGLCSYEPDRCEVYVGDNLVATAYNPRYDNCRRVEVPVGVTSVEVICYGGNRPASTSVSIACW
jgi:hypothetical protein